MIVTFKSLILCLILICPLTRAAILRVEPPVTEATAQIAFDKLLESEVKLKDALESMIKSALPNVMGVVSEVEISGQCLGSLLSFTRDLRDMKLWTTQMLDAMAKPVSSLLRGSAGSLGDFEECLNIRGPVNPDPKKQIKGKYCLVDFTFPLPPKPKHVKLFEPLYANVNGSFKTETMDFLYRNLSFALYDTPLRYAICIPSLCSGEDVLEIAMKVLAPLNFHVKLHSCQVDEPKKVDSVQIAILSIIGVLVLLCVVATCIEILFFKLDKPTFAQKIILAFSIRNNLEKGFDIKKTKPSKLDFLYGLRYLSSWWVIYGHVYLLLDKHLYKNLLNVDVFRQSFPFLIMENSYISVETFLFIAALLMSYMAVSAGLKRPNSYRPIKSLICRVWRLLPSVLLAIGITIIFPLFSSGPLWNTYADKIAGECRHSWWTNILFINNFVPMNRMCYIVTWYLAVDVQCYILGIIYILIYQKSPNTGNAFLAIITVCSILSTGILNFFYDFPPTVLYAQLSMTDFTFGSEFMTRVYQSPHVHVCVFAVGLYTGTLLASRKLNMNRIVSIVGWVVSIVLALITFIVPYPWHKGEGYSVAESFAYGSLYRTAWALSIAWISIACFTGHGGIANYILSFPIFKPLGQITYWVYLIHYLVVYYYMGSLVTPVSLNHISILYLCFAVGGISHILALICHLIVEAPMSQLGSVIFDAIDKDTSKHYKPKSEEVEPEKSRAPGATNESTVVPVTGDDKVN